MCACLFVVAALLLPPLLCPLFYASSGTLSLPALSAADRAHNRHHSVRLWLPLAAAVALFAALAALLAGTQARLLRARLACARRSCRGEAEAAAATAAAPEEFALLLTDVPQSSRSQEAIAAFFSALLGDHLRSRPDAAAWPKVLLCPPVAEVEPAWEAWRAAAGELAAAREALAAVPGPEAAADLEHVDPGREEAAMPTPRRAAAGAALAQARARRRWTLVAEEARWVEAERARRAELAVARAAARAAPSRAAVVLLPTRGAAAAALAASSSIQASNPGASRALPAAALAPAWLRSAGGGGWLAQPCPPAEAVNWGALQSAAAARGARTLLAHALCALLVVFFLAVVAAVSGMSSLSNLESQFPHSTAWLAQSPQLQSVLEGYLAVAALLACLYAAPPALKALTRAVGGYCGWADADASAGRAMLWLYLLDVFLGAAAIQALLREVAFASGRAAGLSLHAASSALGGSVAAAAPFFLILLASRAGSSTALQLLRAGDLPVVLWRLAAARGRAARRAAWAPRPPAYVDLWPASLFALFLGLVYGPLSPLLLLPAAVLFSGGAATARLHLLYVSQPSKRGAGRLWAQLREGLLDCACLAAAVLAAAFALQRAPGPATAAAALLAFALLAAHAARGDAEAQALSAVPREAAEAADAAMTGGGLRAGALPWPWPEAFLPACFWDEGAAEGGEEEEELARRALRRGDALLRGEEREPLEKGPARYGATAGR